MYILVITVLLLYLFITLKKGTKKGMYSYTTINKIAVIIFLFINLIYGIYFLIMFGNGDILNIYNNIISSFKNVTLIGFPLIIIFSIYLVISNIKLIKMEGLKLPNILGAISGFFLISFNILFLFIYDIMSQIIDVHSNNGYYISLAIENILYTILCYIECIMISTIYCTIKAGRYCPKYDKDFIIILGCGIHKDGTLKPLLKGRADKAIEFAKNQQNKTGKRIYFVPSGGKGDDEIIAEGEAIKNYLISQGIDESMIYIENKSKNTLENMKFSKQIIDNISPNANAIFSTTNYHVFRSGVIANSMNFNCVGIGSKTKWYFYINAVIREFIANMNIKRKKHIINLALIIGLVVIFILISYCIK